MKNKYAALFLGWLVPGLGHLYIGKRWKAAVFFGSLMGAAWLGLAMGHFRNVYFASQHYQQYAEMGNGLFTIVGGLAAKLVNAVPVEETERGAYLAGTLPVADLYLMVAGLLNYVVAANAFDEAGRPAEKAQAPQEQEEKKEG